MGWGILLMAVLIIMSAVPLEDIKKAIRKKGNKEKRQKGTIKQPKTMHSIKKKVTKEPVNIKRKLKKKKRIEVKEAEEVSVESKDKVPIVSEVTEIKLVKVFDKEEPEKDIPVLNKENNIQEKRSKEEIPEDELEWIYQRERAFTLYGKICRECGGKEDIDVHHIVPRKMGGSDELENLEILCRDCHSKLHGYEIEVHGKALNECLIVSNKMLILNKALANKKIIEFDYVDSKGEKSHRFVQPAKCEFKKPGELDFVRAKYSVERIAEFNRQQPRQYFIGFCYNSRLNRRFRVSRMSNLAIKKSKG